MLYSGVLCREIRFELLGLGCCYRMISANYCILIFCPIYRLLSFQCRSPVARKLFHCIYSVIDKPPSRIVFFLHPSFPPLLYYLILHFSVLCRKQPGIGKRERDNN